MSTINLTIPRGYAEMTEKQVRYVAALIISGEPEERIRTKCFIRFAGIRPIVGNEERYWFTKPKLKGFFSMRNDEVSYFADKMEWLTLHYAGIKPIRQIGKYQACDELLRDTNFIQYLDAENYYQAFLFRKDEKFLIKMMASLYQPGAVYSNLKTEQIARKLSRKAGNVERMVATMWMIGVKEYFSRKFKYLFKSTDVGESDTATPPNMHDIIQSQIRALTNGDITKESNVLQAKTWSALSELNEKCREAEEYKRNNK